MNIGKMLLNKIFRFELFSCPIFAPEVSSDHSEWAWSCLGGVAQYLAAWGQSSWVFRRRASPEIMMLLISIKILQ